MSSSSSYLPIPTNIELPFFAYGIFRPGQLGFFQISDFVERFQQASVKALLVEKDGIPLLISKNLDRDCSGYLLFPKEDQAENFYKTISNMEPADFYRWETIKVNQTNTDFGPINANILSSRRDLGGTHTLEKDYWDGREDPLFVLGIDEVRKALSYCENAEKEEICKSSGIRIDFPNEYRKLFRYHMAYLLLWTIIERYGTLRYGMSESISKRNEKISQEKAFMQSLKKIIPGKTTSDRVFPSNRDRGYCLNSTDPISSIKYFYAIRSNAAHRGKAIINDSVKLENATKWLLEIFEETIRAAWEEAKLLELRFLKDMEIP